MSAGPGARRGLTSKPTMVMIMVMPSETVMPRVPHDPFITDERFDAMLGLQFFLRRDRTQAVDITQAQAEAALRRNPEVADRFFDLFPFLMEKAA